MILPDTFRDIYFYRDDSNTVTNENKVARIFMRHQDGEGRFITKTRLCNILQFFTAVKMLIFR